MMRSIVAIWRDRRKMPSIAMHLAMRSAWAGVSAMRWSPLMMPTTSSPVAAWSTGGVNAGAHGRLAG